MTNSHSPKRPADKRPRRLFPRSIALVRFRWEILRRTSQYRNDFQKVLHAVAESTGESEAQVARHCLTAEGGTLIPDVGAGNISRQLHDEVCKRYGLRVLMHPSVAMSEDEMADYPLFSDSPRSQPVIKDRDLMRRLAMMGNVSRRDMQKLFGKTKVDAGPYQVKVARVHLGRLDTMLAVFDAHTADKTPSTIAKDLGLSIDQVKRASRTARKIIDSWLDFDAHATKCGKCQAYRNGKREHGCRVYEMQLGIRSTRGVALLATRDEVLDEEHARRTGAAPARGASKPRDRIDKNHGRRTGGAAAHRF